MSEQQERKTWYVTNGVEVHEAGTFICDCYPSLDPDMHVPQQAVDYAYQIAGEHNHFVELQEESERTREALEALVRSVDVLAGSCQSWVDPMWEGYGKYRVEQHREYEYDTEALEATQKAIAQAKAALSPTPLPQEEVEHE